MAQRQWRNCGRWAAPPSPSRKKPRWSGACPGNWCVVVAPRTWCRSTGSRIACFHWCLCMPLVRKPAGSTPPAVAPTQDLASGLASPGEDARWMAARDAAGVQGCADMLAAALRVEPSPRVREALFMSLARTGDAPSVDALQSLLRSDAAHLRTGALDALRLVVAAVPAILSPMLRDHDADIRILSCELARTLPAGVATAHLNALLRDET